MLHLIISTPRSGSNSLCRYVQQQVSDSENLFEVITDVRDEHSRLSKDVVSIFKNLMVLSTEKEIVAKCHVEHLLLLYPAHVDILDSFLKSSKLYYCLRLNLCEQIKSYCGIEQTGTCDVRTESKHISITGEDALRIYCKILQETEIQGEMFKHYPGELMLLENMTGMYTSVGSEKYKDTYQYKFDSEYTKKFVEQPVDMLSVFEKGNSLYRFIGA